MLWESHRLDLSDVSLRYHSAGESNDDQPSLVFLHYFGGSSQTWEPVVSELANSFSCLALDLRGSGNSRVTPALEGSLLAHSLDAMVGDVAALLGHLGCHRYVLIGHSMGGKVALALATSHGCPRGLQALALVAPSPPSPEPMPEKERSRLLAGQGSESVARETLAKITAQPLPAAQVEVAVADQLLVAPAAWRAWLEYGSRLDITNRMHRIDVPVHLLAGGKDDNITPALLRREITKRLPTKFAREPGIVSDAAHLLPLEASQAVADFIRSAMRT